MNRQHAIIVDTMSDHELIAVDATGQTCQCGHKERSLVEHFADVALDELGAPRHETTATRLEIERTQQVIAQLATEADALAEELASTGLSEFVERADWLIAHRSPLAAMAWDLKWARLGVIPEPVLLLEVA